MKFGRKIAVLFASMTMGVASAQGELLPVLEGSFENPVVPLEELARPFSIIPFFPPGEEIPGYPWVGEGFLTDTEFGPLYLGAGVFPNNPLAGFLTNMHGNQAAFLGGEVGNNFSQVLAANYESGQIYTLRAAVAVSEVFPPASTAFLRAELFYLDELDARQSVAFLDIYNDVPTGLSSSEFTYFEVSSSLLDLASPAVGRPVGILFSFNGTDGGFFDIDDVTVSAVPEPAAVGMLCLGALTLLRRRR